VVKDLIQGKLELPKLCKVSDLIIADSDFNAAEILELGFKAKTLPLSIGENHLLPNEGILNLLRKDNLTHLLHVGRLAPNKCLEDLLKIFYFYHHKINQNSRLWLVGTATDTEIYKYALERLSYELDLSASVTFTGSLSDEEVLAFYQGSSLYITMSEHEGFCLPLMEAARSSLPVLAYASSAIPETLGESGVLVYGKKDPARIAEVIEQIRLDNELKARLIEGGKSRAKVYSVENFTHNFFRILSLKV
jgi:glycosyltransferase involved in cell wall biosynthesis